MDFFYARLPSFWKRTMDAAVAALSIAVCLFMAYQSCTIAQVLTRNGQRSLALEVPMIVPQASLLIGFLAIACAVLVRFILGRQTGGRSAITSGDGGIA
jgi:TRAP-type C4-dicarboxylate transport system permease small subunit